MPTSSVISDNKMNNINETNGHSNNTNANDTVIEKKMNESTNEQSKDSATLVQLDFGEMTIEEVYSLAREFVKGNYLSYKYK